MSVSFRFGSCFRLCTRSAQPKDIDDVLSITEAVHRRGAPSPLLYIARLDLDRKAAPTANEVMVMTLSRAGTVQRLTVRAQQRIRIPRGSKPRERPVHGRQANAGVLFTKGCVQVLRAHKTACVGERFTHSFTLPCIASSHNLSLGRVDEHQLIAGYHLRALAFFADARLFVLLSASASSDDSTSADSTDATSSTLSSTMASCSTSNDASVSA